MAAILSRPQCANGSWVTSQNSPSYPIPRIVVVIKVIILKIAMREINGWFDFLTSTYQIGHVTLVGIAGTTTLVFYLEVRLLQLVWRSSILNHVTTSPRRRLQVPSQEVPTLASPCHQMPALYYLSVPCRIANIPGNVHGLQFHSCWSLGSLHYQDISRCDAVLLNSLFGNDIHHRKNSHMAYVSSLENHQRWHVLHV